MLVWDTWYDETINKIEELRQNPNQPSKSCTSCLTSMRILRCQASRAFSSDSATVAVEDVTGLVAAVKEVTDLVVAVEEVTDLDFLTTGDGTTTGLHLKVVARGT